jgi:hypothetical protein
MRRSLCPATPVPRARKAGLLLVLLMSLGAVAAHAGPVDASHPVAGFLRRLEEKGLITPGFWSTLPRDDREVARALVEAATEARGSLTPWDQRRLQRYLEEFDPARRRRNTRLQYHDTVLSVRGHVESYNRLGARDSLPAPDASYFGTFTVGVDGTYGERLHFTAQAFLGRETALRGRFLETYDPLRGLPYGTSREGKSAIAIPQRTSTFDGFRTIVGYGDGRLTLEAGQDWNQWGPGRWQHATLGTRPHFWVTDSLAADPLSGFAGNETAFHTARRGYRYGGEGAPLPQVRIRLNGARWEYVKVVAERTGLAADSAAWLIAHRAQLRLGRWKIGLTEMLTVGARTPDLITMLPGVPLKFAEHSGGDLDNTALAADVEWTLPGYGRLYGELFVDDYSGPPLDFRGNKFAVLLGGSWQDPFGLPATLHAEYASVDPWTYGHHRYNTAMQHYGALLGSALPPNARAVTAAADFPLPLNLEGNVEWRLRQRDVKSRGSSIFNVYGEGEPSTKAFLEQDVETRHEAQLSAAWHWRRHARVQVGVGGLWADNWRGHPGVSHVSPSAFAEVTLWY